MARDTRARTPEATRGKEEPRSYVMVSTGEGSRARSLFFKRSEFISHGYLCKTRRADTEDKPLAERMPLSYCYDAM